MTSQGHRATNQQASPAGPESAVRAARAPSRAGLGLPLPSPAPRPSSVSLPLLTGVTSVFCEELTT